MIVHMSGPAHHQTLFWTEEMRRRKSGSLINLSTWNRDHVLNTERWNGDKQVVANVWTGQSPSASSPTCDSQASDQKKQKSISQSNTVGMSRASLYLIFLWLHKPILRFNRGNVMKTMRWEMALINSLVSTHKGFKASCSDIEKNALLTQTS